MALSELWDLLLSDPADWHTFYPPVSDVELASLGKVLSRPVPSAWQKFLKFSDGAYLFRDARIFGLNDRAELPSIQSIHQKLTRQNITLPANLVPFAEVEGIYDCFAWNGEGKSLVGCWDPESGHFAETHETFDEWLFELTESLRMIHAEEQV